jgi:hypothetical protein
MERGMSQSSEIFSANRPDSPPKKRDFSICCQTNEKAQQNSTWQQCNLDHCQIADIDKIEPVDLS